MPMGIRVRMGAVFLDLQAESLIFSLPCGSFATDGDWWGEICAGDRLLRRFFSSSGAELPPTQRLAMFVVGGTSGADGDSGADGGSFSGFAS